SALPMISSRTKRSLMVSPAPSGAAPSAPPRFFQLELRLLRPVPVPVDAPVCEPVEPVCEPVCDPVFEPVPPVGSVGGGGAGAGASAAGPPSRSESEPPLPAGGRACGVDGGVVLGGVVGGRVGGAVAGEPVAGELPVVRGRPRNCVLSAPGGGAAGAGGGAGAAGPRWPGFGMRK